jgi:hypothetical protein
MLAQKQMKLCKAWPEACQKNAPGSSDKLGSNLDHETIQNTVVQTDTLLDSLVLPKSVERSVVDSAVNRAVDSAVEHILKDAFGPDHDDPIEPEAEVVALKKATKRAETKSTNMAPNMDSRARQTMKDSREDLQAAGNNMNTVWVVLGIFAVIVLFALQGLYSRIESMESWLHGRLTSRP